MATSQLDYGEASNLAQEYAAGALGLRSPGKQVVSSAILTVVFIATSYLSLGATLVLASVTLFWFVVGLLRFLPPVNRYWPLT